MKPDVIQRLHRGCQGGPFATTHWSLIQQAAQGSGIEARAALEELCTLYWPALYRYLRRLGHPPEAAEDLVQGCFARLLASPGWLQVSPDRGRFRSWLLGALRHHLADASARAHAQRRGAGIQPLDFDAAEEEGRLALLDASGRSPEQEYHRRWALALLDQVRERLAGDFTEPSRARLFDRLRGHLPGGGESAPIAVIARDLGMTEGAVKVAVHRLRQRYRQLLRDEVARLVSSPDEVEDELRFLIAAVATG